MSRLRDREHQAYLVGGAVRDLLLGGHPKDFDIATDATPEEVHALFSNSRIIGRRFRIVHVRFGREVIEVTTFRGHHDDGDSSDPAAKRSSRGLLLRDNVFGTLEVRLLGSGTVEDEIGDDGFNPGFDATFLGP